MRQLLRLLVAIGVIAFAASMLAVSCGKTAGGGNNNNNANNSGSGNGGGNATCTGICPTTNLILGIPPVSHVKISGNTVTVNANALTRVHSDADDDNRGYQDASGLQYLLLNIAYPGAKAALFFVSRSLVTKDNITVRAATTGTGTIPPCTSSESGDDALASAAGGAHCRSHATDSNKLYFYDYLGTVFNNTKTTSHARGLMGCDYRLDKRNPITDTNYPITDTLIFDANLINCSLAMVNSGGGAAAARIDDAWVGDSGSTSEVELYAIGIDVTGKTFEQISGLKKADFDKALDNAAVKKMLRNNKWGELKFKVKLVKSTDF